MEPFREKVVPTESRYPLRLFTRSSMNEYIHVHPHWHDEYEILLIHRGCGIQQIGPLVFPFTEGDILPIPSGAVHSTYTDTNCGNEILVLTFPRDFPGSGLLHFPEQRTLDRFYEGITAPPVIHPSDDPENHLHRLLTDMEAEWQGKSPARELLIRARLLEWIAALERLSTAGECHPSTNGRADAGRTPQTTERGFPNSDPEFRHREDARIKETLRRTFDRIDAEYDSSFRVADAAREACLSVSQFERLFKAHTGQTFLQYLNRYRVHKACERLDTGDTLTEIAFSCGFGSLATFTRVFRQIKGMPPSRVRTAGSPTIP